MSTTTIQDFAVHNFYISNATSFEEDWHVRVTWIAFMTLWFFWGLVWCIRSFFTTTGDITATQPEASTDAEAPKKKFSLPTLSANGSFAGRVERGYGQVTGALFSLLCLLSMNTFARASTRAVMILAWFFLAFAVFWFFVELIVDSRFVRVTYSVTYYGIGLAIAGLAFKQGFY